MATYGSTFLNKYNEDRFGYFYWESVSSVANTAPSGTVSSYRTCPANTYWDVQSVRATHSSSSGSVGVQFDAVDPDGITHITLSNNSGQGVMWANSGDYVTWNGHLTVPGSWRIYSKWFWAGSPTPLNWQMSAMEYRNILPL